MKEPIGTVANYLGTEHGYLKGCPVRIKAVFRNAIEPGIDVDGPEFDIIDNDDDLERAGGITTFDRIEVEPWIEQQGRFSFVTSDPRAEDLDCFRELANNPAAIPSV